MTTRHPLLAFRCTGCGNCCKEPLLPVTDLDVRRIVRHTGEAPHDIVRFVGKAGIDLDGEPEAFALVRQGRRTMILGQKRNVCRYLGADNRCGIYEHRPLGCRVFPFDATFGKRDGKLRRLRLIQAADCQYELDGKNSVSDIRRNDVAHAREIAEYHERVATWNTAQRARRRQGLAAETGVKFLEYLGLG